MEAEGSFKVFRLKTSAHKKIISQVSEGSDVITLQRNRRQHLVVDVVSAHSDGVHDVFSSLVFSRGAVRQVVGVVLCSEVMTELVSRHQVCFLWRRHTDVLTVSDIRGADHRYSHHHIRNSPQKFRRGHKIQLNKSLNPDKNCSIWTGVYCTFRCHHVTRSDVVYQLSENQPTLVRMVFP